MASLWLRVSALIGLLSIAVAPVAAHHDWSGNAAGEIEITGTLVTGVSLAGPHGTFQVRDADGQAWNITLAPGPRTHRSGLRENVIPVGAEVTVQGERNEDPDIYEAKLRRVIW
jgi:hypothetical protein